MANNDQSIGPLVVVALVALVAFWYVRSQSAAAALAATPVHPPGTVVNPQPTQDPTLTTIENHIPVIGPLVSPMINGAGNFIVKNQFLESHSQVGPNAGQTEASAGVLGVTAGSGISYDEWGRRTVVVGHAAVKAADKLLPWNW